MKYILLSILLFTLYTSLFSQTIMVPVNDGIYDFIERLYVKNIIDINDAVKPFSRKYIGRILNNSSAKLSLMTEIEIKELEFYKKEYFYEIKLINNETLSPSINYFGYGESGRFRLFSCTDSLFTFNADLISGYDVNYRSSEKIVHGRNGFNIFGSFQNNLGFHLTFYDNTERGGFIDRTREFSENTGYNFKVGSKNSLDYDDVNGSLTYSWKWGDFSFAKDYMKWGSGISGQVILSNKAPSFPMIRLKIYPEDWINFIYIHGYLNSATIDSSSIRINTMKQRLHYELIEKFFVAHMLSIKPLSNLNISLGESVVYSDRFEPIYLIPFLFFRMADHYLNYKDATAGNAQLFGDISWTIPKLNSKLYSSLFIDEFSISNIEDGDNQPSAVAYTFGYQVFDPFIKDLEITAEYTRINPFVYFHIDDAQGYSNYNYQMGHWIGSNGDQLYFSAGKSLLRGLKLNVYWEHIRKGQKETRDEQRYQSWQTFLYGLRTNYIFTGIDVKYEIIHNLFAKLNYRYSLIDHEQKDHSFIKERYNDLSAGLSYGF